MSNGKREFKPGTLCYLNAKCGIPENVGKIVQLVRYIGTERYGDGLRYWLVKPQSPLTMALQLGYFIVKKTSDAECDCFEPCMVPINDPDLETDDVTSKDLTEVLQ